MFLDEFVTNPPHCVFCGATEGLFRAEDVFPIWFRKVLPPGNEFKMSNVDGRLPDLRAENVLRLKLEKAVCHTCNNVWMSTLEKRVKKTIRHAMLAHEALALDGNQQDDLARWAAQKALTIQLAWAQKRGLDALPFVTHEHLAWLYEQRETKRLPPGSRVWLFPSYVPTIETPRGLRSRAIMAFPLRLIPADQPVRPLKPCGLLATFTIAHLGFQVFLGSFSEETPERPPPTVPPSLRPYMTRIGGGVFPTAHWPRGRSAIDGDDDFVSFARWDGELDEGRDGYRTVPAPSSALDDAGADPS